MRTEFSDDQRHDPAIRESEQVLRSCVHCGFCLSSCPTYVELGDELDSPRGRIYLIKEMLETGAKPTSTTVTHLDRCLSCLACQDVCPSDVNYMHLIDHARSYIEETYQRPAPERALRRMLGYVLPRPDLFASLLKLARWGRPVLGFAPKTLKPLIDRLPERPVSLRQRRFKVFTAEAERRARVALLQGCVQQTLGADINEATIRLLTRLGCEVVLVPGAYCCGAVTHHLGQDNPTLSRIKGNIAGWEKAEEKTGAFDAIIANASGCGTMLKDYGFLLREDAAWAERAKRMAGLSFDVSEFITEQELLSGGQAAPLKVAYQSPCSLQHGQGVKTAPMALLKTAGFEVVDLPEGHLCCGAAGTYNLLQPELSERLKARKLEGIATVRPDVIASGNLGCMMQLSATEAPMVHTVELLDWATGGPEPVALKRRGESK